MTSQTERTRLRDPQTTIADRPEARTSTALRYVMAALRLSLGWIFLCAFLDKTFGLGHGTTSAQAWISGGHPTSGFLAKAAEGPFKGFYNGIAGDVWVNWAFMLGLLFIGVALTFGIAIRLGALAGLVMYLMMWSVALLPATNPVIDDHILGAAAMAVLGLTLAGDTWGFGKAWSRVDLVADNPVLR